MAAISDPKRKSGISLLGDAPWGTHFCQFYRTKQDLIDILVPYFKAGLENNEFCLWVTSEPLPAEEARAELQKAVKNLAQYDKKGQIEILDFSQWYTRTGKFDAGKVLQGWVDKEQQARKNGFEGLRLSGNTFWLEPEDWKSFADYEATVNDVIHKYNMFALCTYSLDQCDANQILDVFSTHQFALINRNGKWATIKSTELKGTEAALRQSEEQFRLLVQNLGEGIGIVDFEEHFVFANPAGEEIFGTPPSGLAGRRLDEFMDPEEYLALREETWKRKYGEKGTYEMTITRADGEKRILQVTAVPWLDKGKNFSGTFGIYRDITEHKRAEEALRESEQRYRTLAEVAHDVIFIVGRDGAIQYLNSFAARLYGFSPEEIVGKNITDLFLAPFSARQLSNVQQVFETGEPLNVEAEIPFQGQTLWLNTWLVPLKDQAEKPNAVLGVSRDITERKRAEDSLRQSEERFRVLFEQAADIIISLEIPPEGSPVIRDANRATFRLLGYERDELIDQPVSIIEAAPDASKLFEERREKILSEFGTKMFPAKHRCKDGTNRDFECSVTEMQIGSKTFAISVERDITERKRAEEALKESLEFKSNLLASMQDGLTVIDPAGIHIEVNPALCRMTGFSREELIGTGPPHLYWPPEEYGEINRAFERTLQGEPGPFDLTFMNKDGTRFPVQISPSTVRNQDGQAVSYMATVMDLTERKRLEEQLAQSQKLESLGMLAGGIAHEFNNILGGILGYASLMRLKMEPDHPFRGYVETIEKSSQRAAVLTSQLLGFARKGKYDLRSLSLNLLAEDTLAIVRQTFDRAVTVEARLAESLPNVEGDMMQLQQVLMNLCINARDAMPKGGSLVLTTRTEQVAEGDERVPLESKAELYVLLSVADTGCGMDEETQAKIFDPFFTTKEKGKGTGLGLAMVYGVVKNHGGFVTVRSEVGRGSVFTLHLPAAEKPSDRRPEALAAPEKRRGAVPDQTILVVDDEEAIRSLARDILVGEGYRVLLAEDGARALEVYREHQREIGLVVLDLIMPKLGGGEVFLKMKEMDPGVHVLVSSGYSQEGKAQEILSGGALGFVQKPFHVRDLISKVRQGLDGGGIPNGK